MIFTGSFLESESIIYCALCLTVFVSLWGGGRLLSGEGLNMDVFFCLLTGIWANICGVGGWGPVGGGGGGAYRQ